MAPQPAAAASDEELVERALRGEVEAFTLIVGRYQDRLVSFLLRMVGNVETAHDLAQEAFLKVYHALDRFDPQYRFSTWIFRVAHNLAIDEIRRRRHREVPLQRRDGEDEEYELSLPSEGPDPYRELRNTERGRAIEEAIAGLPEDYRELIVLRHYGELAYDEIAALKGMPLGTVKNKLFRGRQLLKEKLDAYLGD